MKSRFVTDVRNLLALPLALVALQACAQDSADTAAGDPGADESAGAASVSTNLPAEYGFVQDALPGVEVSSVAPSPIPGLLEVYVGADVFYVTDDGKYFVQGEAFDIATKRNITDAYASFA